MAAHVLLGRGRAIEETDVGPWSAAVEKSALGMSTRLAFMTADHHRVRNFAVRELPRNGGRPLDVDFLARTLALSTRTAQDIVEELERNLFFLVRRGRRQISWAFPLTVERTSHALRLSSGEDAFGACAEDAFAAPFVLGRLRAEPVAASLDSRCASCGRRLSATIDSEMRWKIKAGPREPLLFEPSIDWRTFQGPNIIHDY